MTKRARQGPFRLFCSLIAGMNRRKAALRKVSSAIPRNSECRTLPSAEHAPHRAVRLLRVAARGEGLAERAEHLTGFARRHGERVGMRGAEQIERRAHVVVGMEGRRRQARDQADRAAVVALLEREGVRFGDDGCSP